MRKTIMSFLAGLLLTATLLGTTVSNPKLKYRKSRTKETGRYTFTIKDFDASSQSILINNAGIEISLTPDLIKKNKNGKVKWQEIDKSRKYRMTATLKNGKIKCVVSMPKNEVAAKQKAKFDRIRIKVEDAAAMARYMIARVGEEDSDWYDSDGDDIYDISEDANVVTKDIVSVEFQSPENASSDVVTMFLEKYPDYTTIVNVSKYVKSIEGSVQMSSTRVSSKIVIYFQDNIDLWNTKLNFRVPNGYNAGCDLAQKYNFFTVTNPRTSTPHKITDSYLSWSINSDGIRKWTRINWVDNTLEFRSTTPIENWAEWNKVSLMCLTGTVDNQYTWDVGVVNVNYEIAKVTN